MASDSFLTVVFVDILCIKVCGIRGGMQHLETASLTQRNKICVSSSNENIISETNDVLVEALQNDEGIVM